ncbi:MAG: AMP-binding protein, partial [Proteobacteria bacterium]|nr:AMP-binding protein [Pseudomonadota bacterium]
MSETSEIAAGGPTPDATIGEDTARLFALVREMAEEQHPHRTGTITVTARTTLDADLALDSLGRMELLGRVEQAFGRDIGEAAIASAATAGDLARALAAAPATKRPIEAQTARTVVPDRAAVPVDATTLLDVLEWHADRHGERIHVRFLASDTETQTLDYAGLRAAAGEVASGLQRAGLSPGEAVGIMLPTSLEFFHAFFGIQMAGGIPVPIYPPARANQIEDHLRRHARILDNAGCVALVTVPAAKAPAWFLRAHTRGMRDVVTVAELRENARGGPRPVIRGEDLAFLQYTSGSTGNPKGVMLTHANLLANIRAMGEPFHISPAGDVFVSWLPLYHDMGLIGAWMCSLYYAMPLVLMSPLRFLTRPERWLRAIHDYRGTISASPNFGYELARARIKDEALDGLDLSSWRVSVNGAEAVLPATLDGFYQRFARCGLAPTVLRPVYGLAENSVGLAFPASERAPRIDRIRRAEFSRSGRAEPATENDDDVLEFPACGQPIPRHEIRVVDPQGREVADRQEGLIEFRGPSSTQGYFRNPDATAALFNGEWLRTGDRGYLAGGEIHVTGREKDTIIRAGRNIYAAEIEAAVGRVDGVRTGCVAVFGVHPASGGTENLVVMAETRETGAEARNEIAQRVQLAVRTLLGEPADEVAMVPPYTVLKTSSGKIRRSACREVYQRGEHAGGRRAVWMQLLRLWIWSLLPEAAAAARRAGQAAYAGWWWACGLLLGIAVVPVTSIVPSRAFCRAWVRAAGRAFLIAVGARPRVTGAEHVPADGPLVIAANHTSYLDGLLILALYPRAVRFVAKNTLRRGWAGPMLRNLGTLFVDRFDVKQGVDGTAPIRDAVAAGEAVVFFPEGTFGRMPGLLPFRMGAFQVAAATGAPVQPVGLRGLRAMLRSGGWFPRAAR